MPAVPDARAESPQTQKTPAVAGQRFGQGELMPQVSEFALQGGRIVVGITGGVVVEQSCQTEEQRFYLE